jgi:hypothetical protein
MVKCVCVGVQNLCSICGVLFKVFFAPVPLEGVSLSPLHSPKERGFTSYVGSV